MKDYSIELINMGPVYISSTGKKITAVFRYTDHTNKIIVDITAIGIFIDFYDDYEYILKNIREIDIRTDATIFSNHEKIYSLLKHKDGYVLSFEDYKIERQDYEELVRDNSYWNRITDIYNKQRKKGIETYGQTLEENNYLTEEERLNYLEEELVDALMYIEHIKAKMNENKDNSEEDLRDDDDV